MAGTTVPARDSSLADLIGPGDSCVPDEPRSHTNVTPNCENIEGAYGGVWTERCRRPEIGRSSAANHTTLMVIALRRPDLR